MTNTVIVRVTANSKGAASHQYQTAKVRIPIEMAARTSH
jgi:hypothetical protein